MAKRGMLAGRGKKIEEAREARKVIRRDDMGIVGYEYDRTTGQREAVHKIVNVTDIDIRTGSSRGYVTKGRDVYDPSKDTKRGGRGSVGHWMGNRPQPIATAYPRKK